MPGTDLRVYRHTVSRGWEEIEIISSESHHKQQMALTVETNYLGIFVVLCCAARTVHTIQSDKAELFGGIGMQITTVSSTSKAVVVCEMEPPIDDYTRDIDLEELEQQLPVTPYVPKQAQSDSVLGHHGDCHPTIFSLRLMEDDSKPTSNDSSTVSFKMTVPNGYCLGLVTENSSTFKRLETNEFKLNSTSRQQLCVWRVQNAETFIHVNRFHQMPLRLFVKLIQNCKNYTLKG